MDTNRTRHGSDHGPQTEQKHPPEWEQDLSPNQMAGQNIGPRSSEFEQGLPSAYDVKEAHRTLHDRFADDELKQIPIVPQGQQLQQGATYVDLRDPGRGEFTAMGGTEAGSENWFIPKDQVPYSLWNRLTGVDDPERIAERRPRDLD